MQQQMYGQYSHLHLCYNKSIEQSQAQHKHWNSLDSIAHIRSGFLRLCQVYPVLYSTCRDCKECPCLEDQS